MPRPRLRGSSVRLWATWVEFQTVRSERVQLPQHTPHMKHEWKPPQSFPQEQLHLCSFCLWSTRGLKQTKKHPQCSCFHWASCLLNSTGCWWDLETAAEIRFSQFPALTYILNTWVQVYMILVCFSSATHIPEILGLVWWRLIKLCCSHINKDVKCVSFPFLYWTKKKPKYFCISLIRQQGQRADF